MDYAELIGSFPATSQRVTWPSPLLGRPFDIDAALQGGVKVPNADFEAHTRREPPRFPNGPSRRPGGDYDVKTQTEKLPVYEKPIVRTPVAGTVAKIDEGVGGVGIVDKNGWVHWFLHLRLDGLGPSDEGRIFDNIRLGAHLEAGSPIGLLDRVGATRDHLHIWIRSPEDGHLYDIENLLFGPNGEVVGIKSLEKAERDIYLQSDDFRREVMEAYRLRLEREVQP